MEQGERTVLHRAVCVCVGYSSWNRVGGQCCTRVCGRDVAHGTG